MSANVRTRFLFGDNLIGTPSAKLIRNIFRFVPSLSITSEQHKVERTNLEIVGEVFRLVWGVTFQQ